MIVDITIQTGFANQSHLTTQFRKIVGIASSKKLKPQLAQELDRSPFSSPVVLYV
jgi:transcriptional regulator GlxA family with amidase domain